MKTLLMVFASALVFVSFGCEEAAVNPIVAKNPTTAAPAAALQKIFVNEQLEVKTPDGVTGSVFIAGEIQYQMTKVEVVLGKELPVAKKTVYNTVIAGKGEVTLLGADMGAGLGKPNTYNFNGTVTRTLEEGVETMEVIFRIEGASWSGAHYHVGFNVRPGSLEKNTSHIDLFPDMSQ